jgi:hypothetical protein
MKIEPAQRYQHNGDELASTIIDGDAVVVNMSTGVYYSLDNTAGAIWQMIGDGYSLAGIASRLAAMYDTTPEQAFADAERLMMLLLEENLIAPEQEAPAAFETEPAGEQRQPYVTPEITTYTDMSDLLALDPPMPGLRTGPEEGEG